MGIPQPAELSVPSSPTLRLQMALPRARHRSIAFPFDSPALKYFYLARNGIYVLARQWNLAGTEVLFPAYCHGVELEALLAAGVKPRFYPVHADMRVHVDEIRSRFTRQTRAVYLIHYLGFPGPVEPLRELCQARGVPLIEDCALALLSRLGDKPLGSLGDAAVFCLYKTLPVPNGGALLLGNSHSIRTPCTSAPSLASTVAYTATAMWRNLKCGSDSYTHRLLQKARIVTKSMSGTLGIVQVGSEHFELSQVHLAMSQLCHWILGAQDFRLIVETRRRNYLHLLERLRKLSPPVVSELGPGVCPLFYPLRTRYKLAILERLLQRGVEAVNFWSVTPPVIQDGAFSEVDELRRTIVELPCHQDLTPEAVDRIADEVHTALRDSGD